MTQAGLNLFDAGRSQRNRRVSRPAYREEIAAAADWKEMLTSRWTGSSRSAGSCKVTGGIAAGSDRDRLGRPPDPGLPEFLSMNPRTRLSPGGLLDHGLHPAGRDQTQAGQTEMCRWSASPVTVTSSDDPGLAVAAETGAAVIIACLNNTGWISIRTSQRGMFGEDRGFETGSRSRKGDQLMPVDFCAIAEAARKVTGPAISVPPSSRR